MKSVNIKSFDHFVSFVQLMSSYSAISLFRGQSGNFPLLPNIARKNPRFDSTELEKEMLADFKRHSMLLINKPLANTWETMIYAQHFGLKTRLLDWTSNPLAALWFACSNYYSKEPNFYVYCLEADKSRVLNPIIDKSPFTNKSTKILHPAYNNERITAQRGWFTAHIFSKKCNQFVDLRKHKNLSTSITELVIPASKRESLLQTLTLFGINSKTIYPDVTGLCNHLNWSRRFQV